MTTTPPSRRSTRASSIASAALLAISLAPGPTGAEAATGDRERLIAVDAHRPLAAALEVLERRHGVAVSYEDPVYAYPGDLDDVTESVRRDLDQFPPGEAPRVLVPRSGAIEVHYTVGEAGVLEDPAGVIEMLIDDHRQRGNPGRFRLERRAGRLLVVPVEVRNAAGEWVEVTPVLDSPISLAGEERSLDELLAEIVDAAAASRGLRGQLGFAPLGPLLGHRLTLGARSEPGRRLLLRALESLESSPGGRGTLVWRLFYDPPLRTFFFNLHLPVIGPDPSHGDPSG